MPNILYPHVRPQDFFPEPVLEAGHIDPGYTGHATDVWRVRLSGRTVALRIFQASQWGGPFWSGMRYLFRWNHLFRKKVAARHRFLQRVGGLPAPHVLAEGEHQGYEYLVMEWMPGLRMESFGELSEAGLYGFGRHLAMLHAHTFAKSGTVDRPTAWPPQYFQAQVLSALGMLYGNFFRDQAGFARLYEEMRRRAGELRVERSCPVLVDLCAGQYLRSEQGELCALVDTDAYVSGPRELDFVILEYGLTPDLAEPFARGYAELLPLPDLRPVRALYRYLYRMMEVEGEVPLPEWMDQPEIF